MDKKTKKPILLIKDNQDVFLGMGFVIASNEYGTYILTASHVIQKNKGKAKGNKKLKIEGKDGAEILCQGNISLNDIAVIFIKKIINYPSLELYSNKELILEGTKYSLIGYSLKENTQKAYTKTEVKGHLEEHSISLLTDNTEVVIYEIATKSINEIDKGYSGTAVFLDNTNIVIGLLSSKKKNSQLAYVIPIQQLIEVWNDKKNWNDESKWRNMPSNWFKGETLWDKIKNKSKFEKTNISTPILIYQVEQTLLEKIKSLFIILGIIGILFFLMYDKLEFFQSKKLIVCYGKRDFNVFPPQYIGCEQVSKNCISLNKKRFAHTTYISDSNRAYKRCSDSSPNKKISLYTDFAQKYIDNKQYVFAIQSYKKAMELDVSISKDIYFEIIKINKILVEENPLNAQYQSDLGWYFFKIDNSNYDSESLNASEIAIEKAKDNPTIQAYSFYNIGLVYEEHQHNYSEALKNYKKALEQREHEEYHRRIKSMKTKLGLDI